MSESDPTSRSGLKLETVLWGFIVLSLTPGVMRLAEAWGSASYLSYGVVIGPLSLYLAWSMRPAIRRQPQRRDLRAAALFALAFGAYLTSYVAASTFGIGAASVATVASATWMLHGFDRLKVVAFPLLLALFAIPPPDQFIALLTSGLQLFVTDAAIELLHFFDLPVARDGNVLLIPNGQLFVAEACSGIASIFALLPAALALAYFTQLGAVRGGALVASVVPIALLWNLARVVLTGVGSLEYGQEVVVGALHEPAGLVTFSLGCVTLLGVGRVLSRGR